jgi:hypothetical protein
VIEVLADLNSEFDEHYYSQVHNLSSRIIVGKGLAFLQCLSNNTVQGLDGIGRINCFSDVFWVRKQCVDVFPLIAPRATYLRVFRAPAISKLIKCK